MDLYVGGQEHAVLHLLYARFWHKVLYKLGVVSTSEPFQKVVHQGMILGSDGEKMSKSRGNVINPDEIVTAHGADALRLYEMFMGPLEAVKPWQTGQVMGVVRFREKVFQLSQHLVENRETADAATTQLGTEIDLLKEMHKTIKKVTTDIETMSFNTAISALMIYTNSLMALKASNTLSREAVETLVLLLSPFAPHIAEECWELLGHSESLSHHPWPDYNESLCAEMIFPVAIQINGKTRSILQMYKDTPEEEALELALDLEKVQRFVASKKILKTIYVPGKIINIVVPKK